MKIRHTKAQPPLSVANEVRSRGNGLDAGLQPLITSDKNLSSGAFPVTSLDWPTHSRS